MLRDFTQPSVASAQQRSQGDCLSATATALEIVIIGGCDGVRCFVNTCHEARMEPCHGCGADERAQKRAPDTRALLPPHETLRSVQRVVCCSSVCDAAEGLLAADCLATFVKRPLTDRVVDAFSSYLASQPSWPDTDDLHPMEATYDRIAVIEFAHEGQTLEAAIGYGRNLPPRHSPQAASASAAIAQVLRVLPDDCAAAAARDASELLEALRQHTGWRQYIVRLELVRGDTCQRWRRSLVQAVALVAPQLVALVSWS